MREQTLNIYSILSTACVSAAARDFLSKPNNISSEQFKSNNVQFEDFKITHCTKYSFHQSHIQ